MPPSTLTPRPVRILPALACPASAKCWVCASSYRGRAAHILPCGGAQVHNRSVPQVRSALAMMACRCCSTSGRAGHALRRMSRRDFC
eukprot:6821820-Prymnesium_polylepis.1